MKTDTTTTVLNGILLLLTLTGVFFAIMNFKWTHDLRLMNIEATQANAALVRMNTIVNEVAAYNQRVQSPELGRILQTVPGKSAH